MKANPARQSANRTGADYFDYFVKTVQIDNKVYDLIADVEKKYFDGSSGYIYTLALKDNNTIKAAPATQSSQSELVQFAGPTSSETTISQHNQKKQ